MLEEEKRREKFKEKIKEATSKWYIRLLVFSIFTILIFCASFLLEGFYKTVMFLSSILSLILTAREVYVIIFQRREEKIVEKIIEKVPTWMEEKLRAAEKELVKSKKKEEKLKRVLLKLKSSIKTAGISVDEIIKEYDKPIKAILLFKFRERCKEKRKDPKPLRSRLIQLGFKHLQSGVYILPPIRVPKEINTQEDLRRWVHQNIVSPINRNLEYVFPFVALIDLRKTFSEKKAPEKAWGRTIFSVLEIDEILPPEDVYSFLKKRHITIEDLIKLGDIVFLASSSCDEQILSKLEASKDEIINKLKNVIKKDKIRLIDIAEMDIDKLSQVLRGIVKDDKKVAKAIKEEAIFWKKFLSLKS